MNIIDSILKNFKLDKKNNNKIPATERTELIQCLRRAMPKLTPDVFKEALDAVKNNGYLEDKVLEGLDAEYSSMTEKVSKIISAAVKGWPKVSDKHVLKLKKGEQLTTDFLRGVFAMAQPAQLAALAQARDALNDLIDTMFYGTAAVPENLEAIKNSLASGDKLNLNDAMREAVSALSGGLDPFARFALTADKAQQFNKRYFENAAPDKKQCDQVWEKKGNLVTFKNIMTGGTVLASKSYSILKTKLFT